MGHIRNITPEELQRRAKRAASYGTSNQTTGENPEDPTAVLPSSSNPESASPPLNPAAQITDLVCRVNKQWDADQSPNKEEFLHDLRIMIGLDPDHSDHEIFSRELRLSDAQRAALIVAVSTVLNIDQRDVPRAHSPSEHHLRELITNRYGSNDDSVQRFQTDLMQEMEKQAQR
jgi:hypothetical protein